MSFPPQVPSEFPQGQSPVASYQSAGVGTKVSGMALTSMILGIVGLLAVCFGGGVLGLVGLILGILGLTSISRNPTQLSGKGFAITGITLGIVSLIATPVLLFAMLMPSLGRARELSNRSYCAANITGVIKAMVVYSNENSDVFPVTNPPAALGTYRTFSTGSALTTADDTLRRMYASGSHNGDVTAPMWVLVLTSQVGPKTYMCKSDPSAGSAASPISSGTTFLTNFSNDTTLSYSIAYPWGRDREGKIAVGPWWRNNTDSSVPVIADMAPRQGSGSPAVDVASRGSGKAWNSGNHGRDGQVVGFGDAHSEFARSPDVGQNMDNIWVGGGGAVTPGMLPATWRPSGDSPFDIVMVPVRNLTSGRVE